MLTNQFFHALQISASCRKARTSRDLGLAALVFDFAAQFSSDRADQEVQP